jgi:hypothetical protein
VRRDPGIIKQNNESLDLPSITLNENVETINKDEINYYDLFKSKCEICQVDIVCIINNLILRSQ